MTLFMLRQNRISHLFLYIFILMFTKHRFGKRMTVGAAGGFYICCLLIDWVIYSFQEMGTPLILVCTLLQILLVQGSTFFLDEYRDYRTLFTGFSAAAYVLAGNVAGMTLHILTKRHWPGLLANFCVHAMVLVILVKFIRRLYLVEQKERKHGWRIFCLIPGFFYLTAYALIIYPGNLYDYPQYSVGILLLLILMIISYCMVFGLLAEQRRAEQLARNNEVLKNSSHQLLHELKMLEENEKKTAIFRHDMRHHLLTLLSYLDSGQYQRMKEVLSKLEGEMETSQRHRYCRNVVLNSIFNYYGELAAQGGVEYDIQLAVPERLLVQEDEVASVCSNLLDNAVQASLKEERERTWIRVRMSQDKERLMIKVENSFTGTCRISDDTGLPLTSNGEGHGFGMRSIAAFAEKYKAFFQWKAEQGEFCVQIILWPKNTEKETVKEI